MDNSYDKAVDVATQNQAGGMERLDKLFAVTQPGAVYSHPVEAEGHTVITVSEVSVGMGFGYGVGTGGGPGTDSSGDETSRSAQGGSGGGGGGGGGGFSAGRPVAIVSISRDGVRVEPVIDVTKLGIAALTAFGAMALMLARMRRVGRR